MGRRTPEGPRRLGHRPVLDGMRGIAVLLVMLMHTGVLTNGYIGVDLFFALSGFLITTVLYEEWEGTGTISLRRFYERRARRLLPALLLVVALFAIVYLMLHPFTGWPLGSRLVTTLLFVNNWVAGLGKSAQLGSLTPTWSLAQEEQFYLIWPLVLTMLLRYRLRPTVILAILFATIVALVRIAPDVEHHVRAYSLYFSPLDRAAELLLGCAGAVVWRYRLANPAHWVLLSARLGRRPAHDLSEGAVSRRPWRSLLCLALAVALGGLLFARPDVDPRRIYLLANALAVPLIIALLGAPGCALAKLIGCRALRYVGRISYCLYLCHLMIRNLLYHYLPGRPLYFYVAVTFALSFAIADGSWRLLEARVVGRGRVRRVVAVSL